MSEQSHLDTESELSVRREADEIHRGEVKKEGEDAVAEDGSKAEAGDLAQWTQALEGDDQDRVHEQADLDVGTSGERIGPNASKWFLAHGREVVQRLQWGHVLARE